MDTIVTKAPAPAPQQVVFLGWLLVVVDSPFVTTLVVIESARVPSNKIWTNNVGTTAATCGVSIAVLVGSELCSDGVFSRIVCLPRVIGDMIVGARRFFGRDRCSVFVVMLVPVFGIFILSYKESVMIVSSVVSML